MTELREATPPSVVSDRDDVIVLDGVRKEFGDFVAVERADFSIARGEFFSLLGPSGCGKTTLLKMIAGFEQPTAGRVLLEGADVSTVPPYKRNVNTVFQQYALFPHMSIVDNVAFGLRSKKVAGGRGPPAGDGDARRRQARPSSPTGARRSCRAASSSASPWPGRSSTCPRALLLDEPLAALDLKLREAMQIELKRIQREVGITFIFVTHDQGEALTMSDRIAVMSRGRVEQIGTPTEIYDNPASIFVAGFIGSANLLPGTPRASAPTARRSPCSTRASSWPWRRVGEARDGDPITVMLRPERITVGGDGARRRPQPAGGGQGRHLPGLVAADDRRGRRRRPSCS